jgi:RNA polymerase sigma-70 factor, ECF subfamily
MHEASHRRHDMIAEPDAVLIARVLGGQTEQFGELVKRYQGALYRHAVSMVLDHDVAADMVQDAFMRAYVNLGACRDHAHFRAWVFQTLRNRCLDYLKEARRLNVRLDDAEPIVDTGDGPMDLVERSQLQATIARALASLSEEQREAFVLRCVEGISYDEMTELLGASVSALKMRVLRAREALAAALQERNVPRPLVARLPGRSNWRKRGCEMRSQRVAEEGT